MNKLCVRRLIVGICVCISTEKGDEPYAVSDCKQVLQFVTTG